MRYGGTNKSFALGRMKAGSMNQTERDYASYLELLRVSGDISWYKFEALKLRLADNTFYTPDFMVMLGNAEMQCHEVKGFWTDDARVKIKVAADMYPFRFYAIKKQPKKAGGGWVTESFE